MVADTSTVDAPGAGGAAGGAGAAGAAAGAYQSREDVRAAAEKMHAYFDSGATLPLEQRRQALVSLRAYLKANEDRLLDCLHADLGKSPFEGYATELGMVYDEIKACLKGMPEWASPRPVPTPLVHFRSSSKVYASPYGVVLVLSPWNYPVYLTLAPLVDAVAAGNCVALKPSRTSKATSAFLQKMVGELFSPQFICAFGAPGTPDGPDGSSALRGPGALGAPGEINDWLLEQRWDQIFFTGNPKVGRTVMQAAARHLTPVTLELGGKNPCIVDASANIRRAAQRIAWGKGLNTGQTCVAPDYLLVHTGVADDLVAGLDACFHTYYGPDILASAEWPRMVNRQHFDRVLGLINNCGPAARLAFGGRSDAATLKIEPACLVGVSLDDPVMNEEVFGPVLPVMTFETLDEAFAIVRHFEKPLAAYVFAEDKAVQKRVIAELPFGGATINDVVIHLANSHMGFGGVGNSGIGAYHGKAGFDTFTHYKSTLSKGTWLELPIRVPPFKNKLRLLRLLLR